MADTTEAKVAAARFLLTYIAFFYILALNFYSDIRISKNLLLAIHESNTSISNGLVEVPAQI